MRHNSVVSGHSKYIGIPWVDGLFTGSLNLDCHKKSFFSKKKKKKRKSIKVYIKKSEQPFFLI